MIIKLGGCTPTLQSALCQLFFLKGLTINDLGGSGGNFLNEFFPQNPFFPGEGPPKIFYSVLRGILFLPSSIFFHPVPPKNRASLQSLESDSCPTVFGKLIIHLASQDIGLKLFDLSKTV